MFKKLIKSRYKKKLARKIESWLMAEQEFGIRKDESDRIEWVLRQLDMFGIRCASMTEIFEKIDEIEQRAIDRAASIAKLDLERRKEAAERNGQNPELVTEVAPMIPDDTPLVCEEAREILSKLRLQLGSTVVEDAIPFLRVYQERVRLRFNEHMEFMITQLQCELERVKYHLCPHTRMSAVIFGSDMDKEAGKPDWGKAGDILIPMWEVLIENGIKHEICTRVKFFEDEDAADEFSSGSESFDEKVLTRGEIDRRIREQNERENAVKQERSDHYGE